MPRRPNLTTEEQRDLIITFMDALNDDLTNRVDWVENRVRAIEDWVNPNPGPKNEPWDNASNITPPLIAKVVRALHARLLGATFNADPWVHVVAVNSEEQERARVREKWLNHQVRNEIPNFYREVNTALLEMIVQGNSFLMAWYDRRIEMIPEWLILDRYGPGVGGSIVERTDQEILDEIFVGETIQATRALGNNAYEVDHISQGYERTARVTIGKTSTDVPIDKVSIIIEREQVIEGVRVKNVPIENLAFPSNAVSLLPEDCHHIFRLYWLYPNQFRARKKFGQFWNLTTEDIENLEMVAKGVSSEQNQFLHDLEQVGEAWDVFQGIEFKNGIQSTDSGRILCIETYYPYDGNRDGVDEQMIFTWIPQLRKFADWDYLSVRFGHRKWPFIQFAFFPITGRLYGLGLAELLQDVQDESATIFNQMNDRENLINNPVLLVEQNAGIAASVFRGLPPGSAIPVRNVDRIKALEWQKQAHGGIPLLQQLYAFAEQIAGVGDIQAGVQPNRPNAPRTARGTLALISEGNIVIDTHVMNVQFISFNALIEQIDGLNRQYMSDEKIFQILGENDPQRITKADLETDVRFYFSGNTTNTNAQVKQTTAQLLYNFLAANPLFTGGYIQMPQGGIEALYRLTQYVVREHTPGKDASFLLPEMQFFIKDSVGFQQAQTQAVDRAKQDAEQANLMTALMGGAQGGETTAGGGNLQGGGGASP